MQDTVSFLIRCSVELFQQVNKWIKLALDRLIDVIFHDIELVLIRALSLLSQGPGVQSPLN